MHPTSRPACRLSPPPRRPGLAPLLALLPALLLPPPTPAQEPDQITAFSDEVSVGVVLVPVVVRSSRGYVTGLSEEDFHLSVDGRPVAIESFERRTDAPVSIVFLQDLSGSMANGGKLAASREAVKYFLERAQGADEFGIATFAGNFTNVEVPFTSNLDALYESLTTWDAYGTTALHDAVTWLPDISAGGTHAKRAAVLITDGADNASVIPPAEARTVVREAQVPVYVLGLGSGSPYQLARGGEKRNRYADLLNLLALYTAGRYFPVATPSELKEAVLDIAEDLRHQYVLGFTTGNGRQSQRKIRVDVDGRRLKVLTRQGYYGAPPSPASR